MPVGQPLQLCQLQDVSSEPPLLSAEQSSAVSPHLSVFASLDAPALLVSAFAPALSPSIAAIVAWPFRSLFRAHSFLPLAVLQLVWDLAWVAATAIAVHSL